MPSPFPGMDPYLERHWGDVHSRLVSYSSDTLNGTLPDDLISRMEERVVIDHIHYDRPRVIYPDVRVYEDPTGGSGGTTATAAATVAQPIVMQYDRDEHTESYITILDPGGQLVTVIEFLSPSNKLPGDARDQYRRKRAQLAEANINIMEIDLIRAGSWRELLHPTVAPPRAESAYRVIIRRIHPKRQIELYPISLRQRLPIVPVPLRATDADVTIDLQALLDQAYKNGRYDRTRYDEPLDPPLQPDDFAWSNDLLASRRK